MKAAASDNAQKSANKFLKFNVIRGKVLELMSDIVVVR